MDIEVTPSPTDFELAEKYQAILNTLHRVSESLAEKHPYEDVEISILGQTCTLTAHELGGVIESQIRSFNRYLLQVQDRISRSEGKVA